jgi:hypothetical protein
MNRNNVVKRKGKKTLGALMALTVLFSCVGVSAWLSGIRVACAAGTCTITKNLPENSETQKMMSTPFFGDTRNKSGGGTRQHKGYDAYMAPGTSVPAPTINVDGQQKTCDIMKPSQGQSALNGTPTEGVSNPSSVPGREYLWNTDPSGYGYYMKFDCSTAMGKPAGTVVLRYAHIGGYNANTNQIIAGRSGIGSPGANNINAHIHYEAIVNGKFIDMECMWGSIVGRAPQQQKKKAPCPNSAMANLCDQSQLTALVQHGQQILGNSAAPGGTSSAGSKVTPDQARNTPSPTVTNTNTTQNPNGSTTTKTTTQNPNGSTTTSTTTTNPDGSSTSTSTTTNPDGSTVTTTSTTSTAEEDESGTTTTTTTTTPPTNTNNNNNNNNNNTTPTNTDTPATADPVAGSDLVPTKPDEDGVLLSGCATDTWTGMVNQAVMEARRETVMNQTYIVKPDSVLVYGCLKHWLKSVQDNAGPIFSETTRFSPQVDISSVSPRKPKTKMVPGFQGLGGGSLDAALSSTVFSAADSYLNANFNHKLLGDTSELTGDAINCNVMQNVWKAAKCKNFSSEKVFYKFDELMSTDPRKYPASIPCNDTGIKQEMIDYAQNKDFEKVTYDKVKTRLDLLADPSSCELSVKTGIKVHQMNQGTLDKSIDDVVCSNVGCGSKKGKCEKL